MSILTRNRLTTSPYYADIICEYNNRLKKDGKVNVKRFHQEVIEPRIPAYKLAAWYKFLNKFETSAGLLAERATLVLTPRSDARSVEGELVDNLQDAAAATRIGIQRALAIGNEALKELLENPELMSSEKRADLLFKAMKAQDSRIQTVTMIRRDQREDKVFQKVFSEAAYGEEE